MVVIHGQGISKHGEGQAKKVDDKKAVLAFELRSCSLPIAE